MRMMTACVARAPQRCTSHLSKHFLLTFQEVTPLSKTRNQLALKHLRIFIGPIGLAVAVMVLQVVHQLARESEAPDEASLDGQ